MLKSKFDIRIKVIAMICMVAIAFFVGYGVAGAGDITLDDTSVFEGDLVVTGSGSFGDLNASNLPVGLFDSSFVVNYLSNGTYVVVNGTDGRYVNAWCSTDLYTAIEGALNSSACVDVYLNLRGQHNLTHGLSMVLGNQRLRGIWHGSTLSRATCLALNAGVDEHLITIDGTTNHDYYALKDLTLSTPSTTKDGVYTVSCLHLEFENVQVYGGYRGWYLSGTEKNRYVNLYSQSASYIGFYVTGMGSVSNIQDLTAYNCPTNFYITGSGYTIFNNLRSISSTTSDGIVFVSCHDITVINVDAELNAEYGVRLYNSYRMTFVGGVIHNNGQKTTNTYDGFKNTGSSSVNNTLLSVAIWSDVAKVHKYAVNLDAGSLSIVGGTRYGFGTAEFNGSPIVYD